MQLGSVSSDANYVIHIEVLLLVAAVVVIAVVSAQ